MMTCTVQMRTVQILSFIIGLSIFLSMVYTDVLKDITAPKPSYSALTTSRKDTFDIQGFFKKRGSLREIDTDKEKSLELTTAIRISNNHGNDVEDTGMERVDQEPRDTDERVADDYHEIKAKKYAHRDFPRGNSNEHKTPNRFRNFTTASFRFKGLERNTHYNSVNVKPESRLHVFKNANKTGVLPENTNQVLPVDLIQSVRDQLREMRENFKIDSVRIFNNSQIPRGLAALGKATFRAIPKTFLSNYRSPCFHLEDQDSSRLACLPYAFLAGFPKCATTDLFQKLIRHPDVVATHKEPHWWTRTKFTRDSVLHYLNHQSKLVQEIEETGNKRLITLDASASTMWDSTYAFRRSGSFHQPLRWTHADILKAVLPDARFLVLFREPAERLYSGYMAFDTAWKDVKSPEDFHQRLILSLQDFGGCMKNYPLGTCANIIYHVRINVGMYSVFLREWMKRYPRNQIHVVRTKDWAKDSKTELKKIFQFLELDPISEDALINITSSSRANQRRVKDRTLGGMFPETRRLLDELYAPFKEDLALLMKNNKYLWNSE